MMARHFPIVTRKDEAKFGTDRTKRVILEIYDAMKLAMETGHPCQTFRPAPAAHGYYHLTLEEKQKAKK